jgi:hypothetical protein
MTRAGSLAIIASMADRVVLCVGTKRGLFVFGSDARRDRWTLRGPFLKGWEVNHAVVDTRGTPAIQAAGYSMAFAATTFRGDLAGRKFDGAKKPPVPPALPPKAAGFVKKYGIPSAPRVWHLEPGRASERGVLYAGTAPAALFRSEDDGKTWNEVRSLTRHPTRKNWNPGAGGQCLHSIQLDPLDERRMYVAISAGGCFRTDDGMRTWTPINRGVAKFVGAPKGNSTATCVHKILLHPVATERLYQQNHVGTYWSDDRGESWTAIQKGLPSDFGFGLALDANDPDACLVVPLQPEGYAFRATMGSLRVYRWNGRWTMNDAGLPRDAYLSVLREGMSSDRLNPCGVYVGTGTGQLFGSADGGRRWRAIAQYLPPILSVSAAVV